MNINWIMNSYNFGIAWNWEFDADFIAGIEYECARRKITTYRIEPKNLQETLKKIHQNELRFDAYYDRATDSDPDFLPLVRAMEEQTRCLINPYHMVINAIDKATMHLLLTANGLCVPATIILPPYNEQQSVNLNDEELKKFPSPFVIKPANTTGGGTGVILRATTIDHILKARQEHKNDKYLIQETILPKVLDGKRAWFRAYFAFGEVIPCWWDDTTHRYTTLTFEEENGYDLQGLRSTVMTIQQLCKLDFFSSEIAYTEPGKFVVVDYVNEVCDMRLQSKSYDGAPDQIVHRIEALIAMHVVNHLNQRNGHQTA